ncbi:MAG: hypothetical protein HYV27_15145 [Candidatus Hydrogenedentes bacterium]|nr:hypothetical protein [Candidatus Hydrogenedentota bacterium]
MDYVKLSLDSIDAGEAVRAVNDEIARVVADVVARPQKKRSRTVTLKIEVTPDFNPETGRTMVTTEYGVSTSLPGQKGSKTIGTLERDAVMVVSSPHLSNLEERQTNIAEFEAARLAKGE